MFANKFLMAWKNPYDKLKGKWDDEIYTVTITKKSIEKWKNHAISRIMDIFIAFILVHYRFFYREHLLFL